MDKTKLMHCLTDESVIKNAKIWADNVGRVDY